MDTGSALGGSGLALSMIGIIYSAINHKHIKSKCCGKELEISIDIDTIQPTHVSGSSKNQTIDVSKTLVEAVAIPIAAAALAQVVAPVPIAAPVAAPIVVPVSKITPVKVKPIVK